MALPLEKFIQQLEGSGILAGDTLQDFIPPQAFPKDAEELARELVHKKKLSKFQVEEIYKGKGKSLTLGKYVLIEKIGAGGMGQVFKAEFRRMKRIVAIKVLPTNIMKDKAAIARFEREVEAAAKISHPNIVAALDAGCANGIHFLVMELVEGEDLSALVKRKGPFSIDQAVNYILQAAKGLQAAHAGGIVHRDIKPANLLLDKKGTVKILDMGLARLNADSEAPTQAELTSTGTIMGTVDYMSPEQALNTKSADGRTDIYALGCSLYYLLSGKAVYDGDSLMAKLLAHREQPIPSLRVVNPEVSAQMDAIFKKLVAKKVEDRYQSMTAVISELEGGGTRGELSIDTQHLPVASADVGMSNDFQNLSISRTQPVLKKNVAQPLFSNVGNNTKTWLLLGGAVLGVLVLLAGTAFRTKIKDGKLVITVNEPNAEVQVLNADGTVKTKAKGGKGTISILVVPGRYRLKVSKKGFEPFNQEFSLETKSEEQITVKLIPLAKRPAMVATQTSPIIDSATRPLEFTTPGFGQWVNEVSAMPVNNQIHEFTTKMVKLNPGFDGMVTSTTESGVVTSLQFLSDSVTDISPVKAFGDLRALNCGGSGRNNAMLTDLSPVKGLSLTSLIAFNTEVHDLSPLKDMPLKVLRLEHTQVHDLSPLKGLTLTQLDIGVTRVTDLSPLSGMPLTRLCFNMTQIKDLSALKDMPLEHLEGSSTLVTDISMLKNMRLKQLNIQQNQLTDLSPLKSMPLQHLSFDFKPERDAELIRSIKTLETINGKPANEFWKEAEGRNEEK